jgi:hypothetical protein
MKVDLLSALFHDTNMSELETTSTIPEDGPIPVVAFDPRLGRYIDNIEFDLVGYARYLKDGGLNDEQIDHTTLYYRESVHPQISGMYYGGTGRLDVSVARPIFACSRDSLNETTTHETEHRYEDKIVTYADMDEWYSLGKELTMILRGRTLSSYGIIVELGGVIHANALLLLGGAALILAGAIMQLRGDEIYYHSSAEQHARNAASKAPEFVSALQAKPRWKQLDALVTRSPF